MRIEQTRREALTEVVISRMSVLVIAIITAELFVYEWFGVKVSSSQNVGMMIYWSFQSILIGYTIRRFFEMRLGSRNDSR